LTSVAPPWDAPDELIVADLVAERGQLVAPRARPAEVVEYLVVEATTRYDGSPVLKIDGAFMAGLPNHP
jgi:hypothetical protein